MRIVFFDKKRETYEAVEGATHMHVDPNLRPKSYVIYTPEDIKKFPCNAYDLHKIDL